MIKSNTRRGFIKKLGLSTAAALSMSTSLASQKPTSYLKRSALGNIADKLRIALIGAGGMGTEDTNTALLHEDIKLVAVCDLYEGRRKDAQKKWGAGLFLTDDHQEILKRNDVDAVIIGTHDHWHKQIAIDALTAGKHVYC